MIDSVVDLVEERVDLGGSRSSESILERWHFAIASQKNVAVLNFWSPCLPQFFHELPHCRCWASWSHDILQVRLVLQRCVYQVALIYHEFAQLWHSCFLQTNMFEHRSRLAWYQVALIYLKNRVLRGKISHWSLENGTFHLQQQTRLACYVDQKEEHKIDFRLPGLSHVVVKEAEDFRVQELVQRIENHPHRAALQADLQQNNVYNPFSKHSKAMIRELGNVELFEMCETFPEVQCSHCLLYWNQGIVHCICGQFLVDSESTRKFNELRLDALSIPHYMIKKGRCRGARHGKTEEQKEYQIAWNAWKRCCKKIDSQGDILQVFTIDFSEIQFIVNHNSQSDGQNNSAKSGMNLRNKIIHINSLQRNREDTKDNGISPWTSQAKMGRWDFDPIFELLSLSKIVSTASQANKLQNPLLQNNTEDGILLQAHRGETSLNGIGSELIRFFWWLFCYSWFRSQSIAIHCNRRVVWPDTPQTSFLSRTSHFIIDVHTHCMAQVSVCAHSYHLHVVHD